jgi:pSer/pThr/pTyr-binding forkhead associated (FHA) protein
MGDGPFAPPSGPGGGALPVASEESIAAAAVVVTALLADGSEAGHFPLPAGSTTVGRDTGSFFGGDGYLSPRHATITSANGTITVRDEGSLNGTFRKLDPDVPVELHFGDVVRIGQALLKVEPIDGKAPTADGVEIMGSPKEALAARVALIVGRDTTANAFPIPSDGLRLGRERGDILLSEDGYVSGLHCRISVEGGKIFLTDLGSSNGTFLRLRDETPVPSGQIVLMGQQLYRITLGSEFRA